MIAAGQDTVFIVAAYAAVAIGTLGLVGWTALAAQQTKRRLAALEARGVRRRSDERA